MSERDPWNLVEVFEEYRDEYLNFESIAMPRHRRPDIAAFLLLDELVPGKGDMVTSAEHDQIWLNVDLEKLAEVATRDHILELVRCGVRFDGDVESLAMFV